MHPSLPIPDSRRPEPTDGFGASRPSSLRVHVLRVHVLRGGTALLAVVAVGQLVFLAYLLAAYARSALSGHVTAWSRFSAHGWMPGDRIGNAAMAAHVLLASVVLLSGTVQLLPVVRRRAPALHRWCGRFFVSGCLIGAVSGLWLVWGRGTVGDTPQHVAISLNAVLLAGCATQAWQTARARQFARHRDWALRTYVVAGGVFYFRILLALWLLVFRRPVGFDADTFSGPFLTALAFGVYVVVPLAVLECARRALHSSRRAAVAALIFALWMLTLLCAAGLVSAALVLWLPKLS